MDEEEKKPATPERSEYKGKPILRIPLVDEPSADVTWHWMSFGKNKAKAIVKWIDEIKKFVDE
jgi:hypothetical protein